MPYLSANGAELYYQDAGDGPPLLMIAGFGSDSTSWAPISPRLAQTRRLIMPDNRAIGRTRSGSDEIKLHDYAEDMIALIDHLGLRSIDLLGHSMGAAIAIEIAGAWPNRIRKLILEAGAPNANGHSRSVIESLTALREAGAPDEHWFRSLFSWIFERRFFEDTRAVDAAIAFAMRHPYKQSAADMRRQCNSLKGVDLTPRLDTITADTLVLAGENDLLYPLAELQKSYSAFPKFRVETIADAAHSLHWDQPEAFISAVSRFLEAP